MARRMATTSRRRVGMTVTFHGKAEISSSPLHAALRGSKWDRPTIEGQCMTDALELLKARCSVPPALLVPPGPSESQIDTLLTIAARVPDHGKLQPWRFIVYEGEARVK